MKTKLTIIALVALIPILIASTPNPDSQYLSPGELMFSPDGRLLYVLCERSDEVRAVNVQTGKVVKKVSVGHVPRGMSLSADGTKIYVANTWDDTVSVIDARKFVVTGKVATGFEPTNVVADKAGKTLYVANRVSNDISVIDAQTGQEKKRLLGGYGSSYLTLSPDGRYIYGTHVFPKLDHHRKTPQSEITIIDTATENVTDRMPLRNIAGVFQTAASADGKLLAVTHLMPKNLIPLAHVEHGYAFGNTITIFGEDVGEPIQVPLDALETYHALPYGVAITPDKTKIYVTAGGTNTVAAIDVAKLLKYAKGRKGSFVNDLSASGNYVTARISVGRNPRGAAISPDGRRLYVANRLDDTIDVIDTRTNKVVSTLDLGGTKTITPLRRGEQIFYSSKYSFQGQYGCADCHIDGTFDGLTWDLEPDGFGVDIVDNRLLEDLSGTEPFKWNGGNPNMPTECGPRTEKFFYRSQSYNEQELADLVTYVMAMPTRPNRWRKPDGELTPAQERGKEIYFRTVDKTGAAIAEQNQCAFCHSGPKYTNRQLFDVGSGKPTDRSPMVDTPQLVNVGLTAPYLHDGSARSLEEIWTVFNPNDTHGRTNDLTKDELNDLIEYLRTL